MTTKPQHEQDYETVAKVLDANAPSPSRFEALTRLHSEAAKVPGLEELLRIKSEQCDSAERSAQGHAERRIAAESERDAAQQERDEARDDTEATDRLYDEVADVLDAAGIAVREDGTQQAARVKELVTDRDSLRERVATLEAERDKAVARAEREWEERQALNHAAEARVKELEAQVAGARNAALEEAANLLDNVDSANPASLIRSLASQPPPAPAQGVDEDVTTVRGALSLLEYDDVGQRTEGIAALDRLAARLATPTPPALVESPPDMSALGPDYARGFGDGWAKRGARMRESMASATPSLVEAVGKALPGIEQVVNFAKWREGYDALNSLLAAYDAAKGGSSGVDGPVFNQGRHEGRSDVFVAVRKLVDPSDANHWNLDGVLKEVARNAEDAAKYRAAVERVDAAVDRMPSIAVRQVRDVLLWMLGLDGTPMPETLDKARVREVLENHLGPQLVRAIARDLGLGLDALPGQGGATPATHPLGCTCDECARDAAIYANRGSR